MTRMAHACSTAWIVFLAIQKHNARDKRERIRGFMLNWKREELSLSLNDIFTFHPACEARSLLHTPPARDRPIPVCHKKEGKSGEKTPDPRKTSDVQIQWDPKPALAQAP